MLSNHFYIGEVKYKGEILSGEQPPILDRALFEAVRQKALAQWSHRTLLRKKSDHLLAGLLFDDTGHRMVPTHATKAGVRYRYYVSTRVLHGEAKTVLAGSISRVPAADIEGAITKSVKEYLADKEDNSITKAVHFEDCDALVQLVTRIVVHKDRLIVHLKSEGTNEASVSPDDESLTIPWQKPPSKKSRQILLGAGCFLLDLGPGRVGYRGKLAVKIVHEAGSPLSEPMPSEPSRFDAGCGAGAGGLSKSPAAGSSLPTLSRKVADGTKNRLPVLATLKSSKRS